MTIASCLTRMLSGAAVAAMFVVSPVVLKIDALGITVAQAVALAQVNPDPIDGPPDGPDGPGGPGCGDTCGPPDGPIDPPGGPIDPPVCDVDCGPPDGPIDPPPCEVDCGPPGGPIDPPPCEVDCGPPDGPIDTPENCETSKEGCEPAPVVFPSPGTSGSDDDDVVPPVAGKDNTAKEDALEFAENLRCQTYCKVVVQRFGNVTITLTTDGPVDSDITTTVSLEGTSVDLTLAMPGSKPVNLEFSAADTPEEAQNLARVLVGAVPGKVDVTGSDYTAQVLRNISFELGSNTQATQAVSDAALGTIESHLESNFESDSSSNS